MFIPAKDDHGNVAPIEMRPCSAITPKIGMAMVESSGKLAIASSTTAPTYICMEEHSAAVAAGTLIQVIRVDKSTMYDTTFSAAATAINLGDKVTMHAYGLQVTATTTSGVAEVVEMDGTAPGSHCRVRF